MKQNAITKKTININQKPVLSVEQKERLEKLALLPDEHIDYSDAPMLLNHSEWSTVNVQMPRTKQQITLRIDADILDFFKSTGTKYQTHINAVLKAYVDAHVKS
jgi:uncharacterized protein (DUF4415 family)